jgi:hypothetical protein
VAKAKGSSSKPDLGALVGTAFPHPELVVMAAAIRLAEKSDFSPPDRAALASVFAKLESAHIWQAHHANSKPDPRPAKPKKKSRP